MNIPTKVLVVITVFCATLANSGALADSLLISNVSIETMTPRGKVENTDILITDGKIQKVAAGLSAKGARIIDGTGKIITPGVFNAFTHTGIVEIGGIESTRDYAAENADFTASLNVIDAFNPNSTLIPHNRIHGVTRALVAPQASGSLFGGKVAIVNLSGSATDSIDKSPVGVLVDYNNAAQAQAGGSRAAALATIRKALLDAIEFDKHRERYLSGEGRELSMSFEDLDALAPIVKGDQYLLVGVDRAADILKILELGNDLSLQLILVGVQEGWMVAEQIALAKTAVIIDPINNLPSQFGTLGARLDNAAILNKHGVRLLFTGMGWQATHNSFLVTQSAGNAVANGLPYQAALEAIFSNPALVFGLENSGKIEAGAIADLVMWNNDPLELLREAELVFVNGRQIDMASRATRLRDRYFERLKAEQAR